MAATIATRASMIPSQIHTNTDPGWCMEDIIEVTADNSYPAGGYPFSNTQLQTLYGGAYSSLVSVDVVNPVMVNSSGVPEAFLASWDKVHSTVRIFSTATDAELATSNSGANGFTVSLRCRFF